MVIATEERTCQQCGTHFAAVLAQVRYAARQGREVGVYCSWACYTEHRRLNLPAPLEERPCQRCGASFVPPIENLANPDYKALYCSRDCYKESHLSKRITLTCKLCDAEFKVSASRAGQLYCTQVCRREGKKAAVERRACVSCGAAFEFRLFRAADGSTGDYCTAACRDEHRRRLARVAAGQAPEFSGENRPCGHCGREFFVSARRLRDKRRPLRYCSRGCKTAAWHARVDRQGGRLCRGCGEIKSLSEFGRFYRGRAGLNSRCKRCVVAAQQRRWRVNIQDKRARARAYSMREYVRARRLAYYKREDVRARVNAYHRAWHAQHPDRVKELSQRYLRTHREQVKERTHVRRARIRRAFIAPVQFEAIYERDGGVCQICREPVDRHDADPLRRPSLDHIVPLVDGGAHAPWNVQLTHLRCNLRRGRGRLPAQLRLVL